MSESISIDSITHQVNELSTKATDIINNATSSTPSDKSDKKSAKAHKKAAKELAKQQREAELSAASQRPIMYVYNHTGNECTQLYGDIPLIQSQDTLKVKYVDLVDLHKQPLNSDVWLRARVSTIRAKGKLSFIVIRDGFITVQCVISGAENDTMRDMVKFSSKISSESIIDICGTLTQPLQPLIMCESMCLM